jgi:hypothetical protein
MPADKGAINRDNTQLSELVWKTVLVLAFNLATMECVPPGSPATHCVASAVLYPIHVHAGRHTSSGIVTASAIEAAVAAHRYFWSASGRVAKGANEVEEPPTVPSGGDEE